jgi:hypothetical protein
MALEEWVSSNGGAVMPLCPQINLCEQEVPWADQPTQLSFITSLQLGLFNVNPVYQSVVSAPLGAPRPIHRLLCIQS